MMKTQPIFNKIIVIITLFTFIFGQIGFAEVVTHKKQQNLQVMQYHGPLSISEEREMSPILAYLTTELGRALIENPDYEASPAKIAQLLDGIATTDRIRDRILDLPLYSSARKASLEAQFSEGISGSEKNVHDVAVIPLNISPKSKLPEYVDIVVGRIHDGDEPVQWIGNRAPAHLWKGKEFWTASYPLALVASGAEDSGLKMSRRDFIKLLGGGILSIPFIGLAPKAAAEGALADGIWIGDFELESLPRIDEVTAPEANVSLYHRLEEDHREMSSEYANIVSRHQRALASNHGEFEKLLAEYNTDGVDKPGVWGQIARKMEDRLRLEKDFEKEQIDFLNVWGRLWVHRTRHFKDDSRKKADEFFIIPLRMAVNKAKKRLEIWNEYEKLINQMVQMGVLPLPEKGYRLDEPKPFLLNPSATRLTDREEARINSQIKSFQSQLLKLKGGLHDGEAGKGMIQLKIDTLKQDNKEARNDVAKMRYWDSLRTKRYLKAVTRYDAAIKIEEFGIADREREIGILEAEARSLSALREYIKVSDDKSIRVRREARDKLNAAVLAEYQAKVERIKATTLWLYKSPFGDKETPQQRNLRWHEYKLARNELRRLTILNETLTIKSQLGFPLLPEETAIYEGRYGDDATARQDLIEVYNNVIRATQTYALAKKRVSDAQLARQDTMEDFNKAKAELKDAESKLLQAEKELGFVQASERAARQELRRANRMQRSATNAHDWQYQRGRAFQAMQGIAYQQMRAVAVHNDIEFQQLRVSQIKRGALRYQTKRAEETRRNLLRSAMSVTSSRRGIQNSIFHFEVTELAYITDSMDRLSAAEFFVDVNGLTAGVIGLEKPLADLETTKLIDRLKELDRQRIAQERDRLVIERDGLKSELRTMPKDRRGDDKSKVKSLLTKTNDESKRYKDALDVAKRELSGIDAKFPILFREHQGIKALVGKVHLQIDFLKRDIDTLLAKLSLPTTAAERLRLMSDIKKVNQKIRGFQNQLHILIRNLREIDSVEDKKIILRVAETLHKASDRYIETLEVAEDILLNPKFPSKRKELEFLIAELDAKIKRLESEPEGDKPDIADLIKHGEALLHEVGSEIARINIEIERIDALLPHIKTARDMRRAVKDIAVRFNLKTTNAKESLLDGTMLAGEATEVEVLEVAKRELESRKKFLLDEMKRIEERLRERKAVVPVASQHPALPDIELLTKAQKQSLMPTMGQVRLAIVVGKEEAKEEDIHLVIGEGNKLWLHDVYIGGNKPASWSKSDETALFSLAEQGVSVAGVTENDIEDEFTVYSNGPRVTRKDETGYRTVAGDSKSIIASPEAVFMLGVDPGDKEKMRVGHVIYRNNLPIGLLIRSASKNWREPLVLENAKKENWQLHLFPTDGDKPLHNSTIAIPNGDVEGVYRYTRPNERLNKKAAVEFLKFQKIKKDEPKKDPEPVAKEKPAEDKPEPKAEKVEAPKRDSGLPSAPATSPASEEENAGTAGYWLLGTAAVAAGVAAYYGINHWRNLSSNESPPATVGERSMSQTSRAMARHIADAFDVPSTDHDLSHGLFQVSDDGEVKLEDYTGPVVELEKGYTARFVGAQGRVAIIISRPGKKDIYANIQIGRNMDLEYADYNIKSVQSILDDNMEIIEDTLLLAALQIARKDPNHRYATMLPYSPSLLADLWALGFQWIPTKEGISTDRGDLIQYMQFIDSVIDEANQTQSTEERSTVLSKLSNREDQDAIHYAGYPADDLRPDGIMKINLQKSFEVSRSNRNNALNNRSAEEQYDGTQTVVASGAEHQTSIIEDIDRQGLFISEKEKRDSEDLIRTARGQNLIRIIENNSELKKAIIQSIGTTKSAYYSLVGALVRFERAKIDEIRTIKDLAYQIASTAHILLNHGDVAVREGYPTHNGTQINVADEELLKPEPSFSAINFDVEYMLQDTIRAIGEAASSLDENDLLMINIDADSLDWDENYHLFRKALIKVLRKNNLDKKVIVVAKRNERSFQAAYIRAKNLAGRGKHIRKAITLTHPEKVDQAEKDADRFLAGTDHIVASIGYDQELLRKHNISQITGMLFILEIAVKHLSNANITFVLEDLPMIASVEFNMARGHLHVVLNSEIKSKEVTQIRQAEYLQLIAA